VDQALDDAAKVGSGPAFAELRYALAEAGLARIPPWDVLATLGRRIALPELIQLAGSIGQAGTEGAKVRGSLRSRAVSLRQRQLSDAEGEANAATERMSLPIVALFAGFLIFLGYPAVAAVLGGL
jgi:Flp pilus assembly protein TadB